MTEKVEKVVYNRKESAAYLGLSENTFVTLLIERKIPFKKVGRRILISKKALDRFMEEQPSDNYG